MIDQSVSETHTRPQNNYCEDGRTHTRCETCVFNDSDQGCKLFLAARNISSRYKDSLEIMIVSRLDNELNTSGKDIMIMECTGYRKG